MYDICSKNIIQVLFNLIGFKMNNIQIFYDVRIVGRTVVTRSGAGSKLDFYSENASNVAVGATILELTGPSYPKLGSKNGKTRWVRFRVE